MSRRGLLRSHLKKAWRKTICEQYNTRLINSEHGLQVYLCAELLRLFKANKKINRRIFVEPGVTSSDGKCRRPDIVICSSRSIIGVVELKYVPRARPAWKKDIETLTFFASNPDTLQIANDRYRGLDIRNPSFRLAPDAVLCWGGVYTGSPLDLRDVSIRDRFLQLNALTADGSKPVISTH